MSRKRSPAYDRATAEVISIVRELLEVEEQLSPLLARKEELEIALEPWISMEAVGVESAFERLVRRKPAAVAATIPAPSDDEPPNRMKPKANPMECPFDCGYEAISQNDLADHVAGCQPLEAG